MGLKDRVAQENRGGGEEVNLVGAYLERLLEELDRDELRGLSEVQRRARLERRLGDLLSIEVTSRDGNGDWGGRVTDMAFIGTTGTARVDGNTVRSSLGLSSDWFTFTVAPRQKGPAR